MIAYNQLPREMAEKLFNAKKGEIVKIMDGNALQLIRIDNRMKEQPMVQLGVIIHRIIASEATRSSIRQIADKFYTSANGSLTAFNQSVNDNALSKRVAVIRPSDSKINGLEESGELVRWAYKDETKKDIVSNVMEINGNGITVQNSRIANGKNVVRSFSSMDLTLRNCMLSNAQNFLFVTGSNEYVPVDTTAMASFYALDGSQKTALLSEFIAPEGEGDEIMNTFLSKNCSTAAERENMRRALLAIQAAVNAVQNLENNFKGSTQIEDCFFYRSGISSICMESLFNSPFLETASPTVITDIFAVFNGMGKSLVPYTATGVSGISYPVQLNLAGDTRFYDYKVTDEIDLSGLIEENITAIASSVGISAEIDIDTIFPLRSMLLQRAKALGVMRSNDGKTYINIPIAFYGGGLNLSKVTTSGFENKDSFSGAVDVDLLEDYLRISGDSTAATLKGLILKTVVTVTGFEPFSFHFTTGGAYFGETPKITDLIANSKGT